MKILGHHCVPRACEKPEQHLPSPLIITMRIQSGSMRVAIYLLRYIYMDCGGVSAVVTQLGLHLDEAGSRLVGAF
jgi:hypothetical protein